MHRLIVIALLLIALPLVAAESVEEKSAARARMYMAAQQGQAMTPAEVDAGAAHLLENPDDSTLRYKLLGYYKEHMNPQLVEGKREQLLWLIENRPEDPILATAYGDVDLPLETKTYEAAKAIWAKQVEAQPNNPRILTNAARFAMRKDRRLVTELLQRACAAEPDNPEWARRLAGVYEYRVFHENRPADRKLAYETWQKVYELIDEQERLRTLPKMAMAALSANAYDDAKVWADRAIASVEVLKPRNLHGEAINAAHTVYGRLALRDGDIEAAKKHLMASVDMPGSMRLNNFGPNLRLAKMLAVEGHRDAVIEYLQACIPFWKTGHTKIDEWIQVLKEGDTPDFGQNMRL